MTVPQGTELTVGARYRITEVSANDPAPGHKAGDVVLCVSAVRSMPPDTIETRWKEGCWFATSPRSRHGGTWITGLERLEQ